MNEITLLHEFAAAGTSTAYRVTGPALLVQTDGITATLQGTNFPAIEASWQSLGQCTGYTPLAVTTSFAFIRVVASGAGRVAVAGASAPAAGAGGGGVGGSGDASAANQLTQIARLDTLVAQSDTMESTLAQVRDRLPATAHSQPLTDAQLRAAPLSVSLPADSDQTAVTVLSPADHLLPSEWDLTGVQAQDIVHVEQTRNQRVIALTVDPTSASPYSEMRSLAAVDSPCEISAHLSMSQRVRMDSGALALVDRTALMTVPGPWTIASISQASMTCTVTLTTPFVGPLGTPIDITGTPDNRMHYQLAPVASISEDRRTLTVTFTDGAAIPSATFPAVAGGTLAYSPDPLGLAATGAGYVFNSSTTTAALLLARSGGVTRLASAPTALATDPRSSTASTSRFVASGGTGHATGASSEYAIEIIPGEVHLRDRAADANSVYTARAQIQSAALAVSRKLTPIVALGGSAGIVRPLAKIVRIVRASNVVTITLDRDAAGAGFAVGQYPQVYGVHDQTNFPNFANSAFVGPVTAVSGNTVTLPWPGTNATSYGGALALPAGSLTQQGLIGQPVQAVVRNADDSITLTGSASWSGLVVDDIAWLVGVRDAATGADLGLDGPWRVSSTATTTLVLRPVTDIAGTRRSPAFTAAASVTCGGAVLLATTVRVHSLRAVERRMSEVRIWGQGANSAGHALPVHINGGWITAAQGIALSATGGTLGWPVSPGIVQATDITSGAITTTTTSGPFTLAGTSGGTTAFQVVVSVSAVSGTSPTMDCSIEVQDDGARWYKLFDLPRITAAGQYSTPELRAGGRAYRIVQTLGGTSPSFTRSIVRNSLPFQQARHIAQAIDRTISLTTLGSATPALYVDGPADLHLVVNIGAATTPPALQLQVSEDNGATWVSVGSPVTAVASGTVKTKAPGEYPRHARAIVTTAGAGVTAGYVLLKAVG